MRTPIVSDHALLRFLERVHKIDVESYRAELGEIAQPAVDKGLCYFETDDLVIALDGDGTRVATVYLRDDVVRDSEAVR